MKKNFKKMMTMISVLLILTLLVSCSSKTMSGGDGDTLELTVWNTQGVDYIYKEMDENILDDWLLNKTGVVVKNIYGNDGGQWDSKLTKLVAGDNLPDVVWCQAGQGPSHFQNLDKLKKVWLVQC